MVPATASSKAVATNKQVRLINILKNDHNYDIVKEIVDHMGQLKRAKKIKPLDKHRMLMNYNLTLLSYCMPKMKIVEDDKGNQTPINFQINIGGEAEQAPAKRPVGRPKKPKGSNVSITIPTKKNSDGSYTVDHSSDPTD